MGDPEEGTPARDGGGELPCKEHEFQNQVSLAQIWACHFPAKLLETLRDNNDCVTARFRVLNREHTRTVPERALTAAPSTWADAASLTSSASPGRA